MTEDLWYRSETFLRDDPQTLVLTYFPLFELKATVRGHVFLGRACVSFGLLLTFSRPPQQPNPSALPLQETGENRVSCDWYLG